MILKYGLIATYIFSLSLIFMYALMTLRLTLNYVKAKKNNKPLAPAKLSDANLPIITIQLPLYNEMYVTERLLNCIAKIQYPKEKLEIQVLDDSTDDSLEITKEMVNKLAANGLDISHITRTDRTGFKAGALKYGLTLCKGEFIAIFDSDFLPQSDWLLQVVPYFTSDKIGLVQTKWGHINQEDNLLTKVQAFALDYHFSIEQVGRNSGGHFINFNGTAGMWRKACIIDAGNWEGDTLTEDLDLSFRAQLNGWEFTYVEDIVTPAELPMVVSAARTQQYRWNKGGAENFQKMLSRILKSDVMSRSTKFHGLMHLLNSTMFLNVFLLAVLSVPIIYLASSADFNLLFALSGSFIVSTFIFLGCYWQMYTRSSWGVEGNFVKYVIVFFSFFGVAMGFSINNAIGVIKGHLRIRSAFVRTPKFNTDSNIGGFLSNKYLQKALSLEAVLEMLMFVYMGFGIYTILSSNAGLVWGFLPFIVLQFFGFGFLVFYTFRDIVQAK